MDIFSTVLVDLESISQMTYKAPHFLSHTAVIAAHASAHSLTIAMSLVQNESSHWLS